MLQNHGRLVKILIVGPTHRISDVGLRWGSRISISKFHSDTDQLFQGPHFDSYCLYNNMIQLHDLYVGWQTMSVCLGLKVTCRRKPLSPRKTRMVSYPTCIKIFPRLLLMGYLLLMSTVLLYGQANRKHLRKEFQQLNWLFARIRVFNKVFLTQTPPNIFYFLQKTGFNPLVL